MHEAAAHGLHTAGCTTRMHDAGTHAAWHASAGTHAAGLHTPA